MLRIINKQLLHKVQSESLVIGKKIFPGSLTVHKIISREVAFLADSDEKQQNRNEVPAEAINDG